MKLFFLVAGVVMFQVAVCIWMMILLRKAHHAVTYKPFWKVFQSGVADSLHHPHPESEELDRLLEQLENLTIDQWGTARLKVMLREKASDTKETPEERNRAEFLLFALPMVVREREAMEAAMTKAKSNAFLKSKK